ncbi:transposase domain-containing protein [Psychrobacillus sp. NPDC096426]|uniref:transposase domain-containing protein n=1 Tax=Psychrobacillus sp. NPDC096426 TaxID=3364491 RepID=UPI0037FBB320
MKGATTSAIIYSIVETAKENQLNPLNYLTYLFEHLPKIYLDDQEDSISSFRGQRPFQKNAASPLKLNKEYTNAHLKN